MYTIGNHVVSLFKIHDPGANIDEQIIISSLGCITLSERQYQILNKRHEHEQCPMIASSNLLQQLHAQQWTYTFLIARDMPKLG